MPRSLFRRALPSLAIAAFAAFSSPAAQSAQAPSAPPPPNDAPVKVWTNDDLRALGSVPLSFDSEAVASVQGAQAAGSAAPPQAKPLLPKTKDPGWYRVQLAPLHAEVAQIEAKQRQIRAQLASHRGGTNALNMVEDPEAMNPQGVIEALEQGRKVLLAEIDALEDLAQRNAIPPGELRREPSPADYAIYGYMQYALDSAPPPGPPRTEQEWRARFAALRAQLDRAQRELDVLQQELGIAWVQYYPDPAKTMKEGYTFREVNQLRARIAEQKAKVASLQQDISDLEDDLRHAGGPPGWSR